MVKRTDLFHLPFYQKEAFTGSDRGLRFWIGREEDKLRTIVWPEPYALRYTDDSLKHVKDFPFSEEGLDLAYEWIMGEGRAAVSGRPKDS